MSEKCVKLKYLDLKVQRIVVMDQQDMLSFPPALVLKESCLYMLAGSDAPVNGGHLLQSNQPLTFSLFFFSLSENSTFLFRTETLSSLAACPLSLSVSFLNKSVLVGARPS